MKISPNASRSPSIYTSVAVLTLPLLLISSALPVKSDAFSVNTASFVDRNRLQNEVLRHEGPNSYLSQKQNGGINTQRLPPLFAGNALRSEDSSRNLTVKRNRNFLSIRGGNTASISSFISKNFFLLGMVVAVSFAKLFPELGKNGSILRPELFIGKYGVTSIFLLSGLSLKMSELTNAAANMKLNGLIQAMSFGAWPFLAGLPLTKGIETFFPNLLPQPLLDGLLILTCLPTTINMCILLTSAAEGNVAAALCNAVISNLAGIFVTPALLLRFFGKSIELPFVDLVMKLCNKVLLPVAIGQALRATPMKDFYSEHKGFFKKLQEMILLGIVWNAFCNAFTRGLGLELKHGIALLTMLPLMHAIALALLFSFFRLKPLGFTSGESVAATFCSAHKTLAFGLPLINTIFEGNPNLASYCAPIMFMHPLQLVIGSLVVPFFSNIVKDEEKLE